MKIDRLIGIITILLQKDRVTTPELADRFEVSRRTIQRDIDAICRAGIPIVSTQGYGGGLSIAGGYRLDKTVLTEQELQAIFTGLKSIDSISKTARRQTLIEKFSDGKNAVLAERDHILIDLASWYQDSLPDKIELLRQAISDQTAISFRYYSEKGETERTVEPYLIVFKWSAWYVYGYCLTRQDYRLFKLNRLWRLRNTNEPYVPRAVPEEGPDLERFFRTETVRLVALFETDVQYRLIEEYGVECITPDPSGKLRFERCFANRDYLLQWVLSFGDRVTVVEPSELAAEIRGHAKNMLARYE